MKSVRESNEGFTIIEVILFLAISSTMIFAAMLAVQGRTRSVQYTDATRSAEAFFDRRISQVLRGSVVSETQDCQWNGGTSYTSGVGNDGSCIFLGYLFELDPSTPGEIAVIQMYGSRLPSNDQCFTDNPGDPLFCANPTPTPVGSSRASVETFLIPWGMQVTQGQQGAATTRLFGYLRDPVGQALIPVSFLSGNEDDIDLPDAYRASHGTSYVGDEFDVRLCMVDADGDKNSYIGLGFDTHQYAVDAVFDEAEPCPNTNQI